MRPPQPFPGFLLTVAAPVLLALSTAAPAAEPAEAGRPGAGAPISAAQVADRVDAAAAAYLADESLSPAPIAANDDLLRRLTLDVAGRLPTLTEQADFARMDGADRADRAVAINALLNDPGYSANWAAYWRDVIFKRATDARATRGDHVFEGWMTEQLAAGRGWDEIATELMTATGEIGENGATGLIFAQGAAGGEVAAEASRIFLGVQIQCAECHDHPYDRWKREDFHTLAAYFPRVRLRRVELPPDADAKAKAPQQRTFEVASVDAPGGDRAQAEQGVKRLREALTRRFRFLDADGDGGLSLAELEKTPARQRAGRILALADKNGDGTLNQAEVRDLEIPPALLANARGGEHMMPDLENPEEPGTRIDPAFFLTGEASAVGLPDAERRAVAADLITGNEWFARAVVNRVFTQLTGEGFYTPVDDIGPDRGVRLEPALDALAEGFVANDHDLRWLIRAICLTDLYSRSIDADAPAFAAARPVRLRAHQIYNSVAHVAGGGDYETGLARLNGNGRAQRARPAGYGGADPRPAASRALEVTFGFDPSAAREDLNGDIPQALALMNGMLTERLSSANGLLAVLLYENPSDVHAVRALYRLTLVREPTEEERTIAVEYVQDAQASDGPGRAAGFEDVAWALLNGAEFLTRR
ncbi:DUF1549 domain-containing protein [Alienimonas californiensis]|uniref:EF hand n=1 Tax=Alienimonas californiensis TaxID=2527989 RepID=A0A517P7X5_9PLAN|nr:DUF1549 domain-containing protein [Alienimonas californiensis]QDT15471.1 EF hand [Alienimonas californiensis]